MRLIDGWKQKFPKLWSVRLTLLAPLLGVAELTLPLFQTFIPTMTFAIMSVIASLAAAVARIIAQPALHD